MTVLQRSYTLWAPFYNKMVAAPTEVARQRSLAQLEQPGQAEGVLLCGIGSGLDIPYLPQGYHYVGIDITWAMLRQAQAAIHNQENIILHQGDVMQLPYPDQCFQFVIMHLILAVVAQPQLALDEASRVLKPSGKILILDKFLQPKQWAPLRRWLSPWLGKIATRTDVVFEELSYPNLIVLNNGPALARGWFRQILLYKPPISR